MYLRDDFQIDDREVQLDIIREDGWGHIVGVEDGVPFASHHPFMLEVAGGEERLDFHMPKASPHWRSILDGEPKLVIFEGPKHYVTPSWCESERALPTWAYVALHVYGRPRLVEDIEGVRSGLDRLVDWNETQFAKPWRLDSVEESHVSKMMRAIVGFEMPIERMEANFRLLQNRPAGDRRRIADELDRLNDTRAQRVAALVRRHSLEAED